MNIESLANELFLDLFEYLSAVHLIHAFSNLNLRLNNLLFIHLRSFGLDFRSVPQDDFNLICRQHLPTIANHITSLRLSNDDDTPQQIDLFLAYGLRIRQFINLQSLSLCDLCSDKIMTEIMFDWQSLSSLTLAGCYLQYNQINAQQLINHIWSLSKLVYCYLNISFEENYFPVSEIKSSLLKYLSIWGIEHRPMDIYSVFKQTPCLEHFSVSLNVDEADHDDVRYSITKLTVCLSRIEENLIIKFLQTMPNLHQLILEIETDKTGGILNGYQWEEIIRNYLPNLQIFRFRMEFQFLENDNQEQQIDELIHSFNNPFWLKEHSWFVRCHWNSIDPSSLIYLYTLPYRFPHFNFDSSINVQLTCPDDTRYLHYNYVNNLTYENSLLSPIRFFNLKNLSIGLPFNDNFWSIIPKFDQITTLDITINDDENDQSQLQLLLDQIPRLYSLNFTSFSQMLSFEFTNVSIRRLYLQGYDRCFNDEDCHKLSRSSLGIQCEILFIKIKNRQNLPDFIHNMINLRVLNIQCDDDHWYAQFLREEDEFIYWLKQHLPSTYMISRDTVFHSDIRIWIR